MAGKQTLAPSSQSACTGCTQRPYRKMADDTRKRGTGTRVPRPPRFISLRQRGFTIGLSCLRRSNHLRIRAPATLGRHAQGPSMLDVALDTTDQHDAFRQALTDHGIRCALELLNDRTSYRFTAIYKLVGSELRAQHAYDRACEYRTWLMVVPLERSFCQYAIESGEFMTSCVSKDPRLANRPYAGMVEAYYGQLLTHPDGKPYGT